MTVKICYHCHPKGKPIFDLQAENAITDRHGNVKCIEKREEEFKARYERMKKQPGQRLSFYHGSGWKEYGP